MGDEPVRRRLNVGQLFRMAWRLGGPTERMFVILGLLVLPLILLPALYLTVKPLPYDESRQALYAGIMALINFAFYQQAITSPMYSPAFFRAAAEKGWVAPADRDFYAELARYQSARGVSGQMPGDVARGLVYYALFIGTVWLSVPLTLALYPAIRDLSFLVFVSLNIPLGIACFVIDGRRRTRQYKKAQMQGFPLMDLYPRRWRKRVPADRRV